MTPTFPWPYWSSRTHGSPRRDKRKVTGMSAALSAGSSSMGAGGWRPSALLDLFPRTAHGRRPSDHEFDAAHADPEKVELLKSAADGIEATRERNVGMRGHQDAIKEAQEASLAFVALHDPPAPVDRLSPDEAAGLDATAARIAGHPAHRGIVR